MGKTVALVVAAGSGSRAGGETPKQYRPIAGKPVIRWAVEALLSHERVDDVRVVIGKGQERMAAKALDALDVGSFIVGREHRALSVINGLEALPSTTEHVLVHDAARPFCPHAIIDRLLDALKEYDGAVPVLPVSDTLAKVTARTLGKAVDREDVVRVQTPQAFRLTTLTRAYEDWRATPPTDETAYLRAKDIPVAAIEGDPMLEKLTYDDDFRRAEALLGHAPVPRVGFGFDVHAFTADRALWLGGIEIPHAKGLAGHSDADVVLHALTDAILGALGAGDIGDHFPPSDPQWRGAPSALFLEHARLLVAQAGGRIAHADVTIICEAPRIGPYRDAMRARIAALLRVPTARISIKATTTERLGFTGRGEGIAAQAVATIMTGDDPC
ncbi:MAG: bifunctional 2-C-methyl-D-erythritol 4-phosphate cytidylyltransferase/2-C-methyl-D-erythritol 2,4-cyclodiphosphate synthase [Sphingomonadaceae bacterium]|nr:bifunctional 2-C-methyl-D-erythritol 4-phosphate cytidylyltransferase/2-C-methyl-D-erythritol 2,4-cyclodiphosphate synthase [Sphingomonadaceae bacterium]